MTEIDEIVEGTNIVLPDYTAATFDEAAIARGSHRNFVGGLDWRWERGGLGQLTFLKKHGLRPEHKFLDVGCGSLRAGRHLVDYLEPGNYYGVDASRSVIQAGYDVELTDEQRAKLPTANLRANDRFNVDFDVRFDFAIAQSVFTHVSLNHMRLCLYRLGKVMRPDGVFFASYVEQPPGTPVDHIFQRVEKGRTYFNEKNVFWYHRSDMKWAAAAGPWHFRYVGNYDSPDQQVMVAYTRKSDRDIAVEQAVADRAEARARQAREALKAGGAKRFTVRARRRLARIVSPY